MTAALVLVRAMGGTDKEVLPLLKVVGGGIVELLLAIITEHQTGEHIALTRCCSAVSLLSDFLHLIKDFQRNNRRMGVVENLAILHRIVPLLLVPNGIGVGFEIDRTACVLHIFENVSNGKAMENTGFEKKDISHVLRGLHHAFDDMDAKRAEEFYLKR